MGGVPPKPMRILIVSFHFPPEPIVGANRSGAFADHLRAAGHDVRVLAAAIPGVTGHDDAVARPAWLGARRYAAALHGATQPAVERRSRLAHRASAALRRLSRPRSPLMTAAATVMLPDVTMGWIRPAVAAGVALTEGWQCDAILATGPPYSCFVVADRLARRLGVPWIADYRDLWTGGSYYWLPRARRGLDRRWEARLLGRAALATTVSEPLAADLRRDFGVRCAVVMNGYDPVDPPAVEARLPLDDARVNILYVGDSLYRGRRTPGPLFDAARRLGLGPGDLRMHFLGTDRDEVMAIADDCGVADLVRCHPRVPHAESLALQARADALLLLLWNDPGEAGVFSGKLFEYVAVGRPVLLVGYPHGVAAELVRSRDLGWVAPDTSACEGALTALLASKAGCELAPDVPAERRSGLDRAAQARAMEMLLREVAPGR